MSQSWNDIPIHVMDFEGNLEYGIIEYGIVTLHHGEMTQCFTRICQAETDIDQRETWCHGLRRQDTLNSKPFAEDWKLFAKLRQSGPFAAHNACVENRLLKRYWPYNTASIDFSLEDQKTTNWGPWVDTRMLYQNQVTGPDKYSLSFLVQYFDLQTQLDKLAQQACPTGRKKYHCALYDTIASALLLNYINQFHDIANHSIAWLITQSQASTKSRQNHMQGRLGEL